ncbi:MAG: DUF411 domain-containing protein [Alphaproteobacteria bacterium]|nr:DUF411 domain-containing protein [Alphaproteobacteria bacterium]
MNRRSFLSRLAALPAALAAGPALSGRAAARDLPKLVVAKTPTCGCCGAWVERMQAAGFTVEAHDVTQEALNQIKAQLGVPQPLHSCHTGQIDSYFIEGHIPAEDIKRLIAERPDGVGIAAPGMPAGSPGMEMGAMRDSYQTLLLRPDGSVDVFARHG